MPGGHDRIDLSIVIVGRGETEILFGCLDSIGPGGDGLTTETFYVDNGSPDDTASLVRERYPWVGVLENGANLGFARANNRALERARGRYLLLINNDTRLVPGSQRLLVDYLQSHEDVGAVGCRLVSADGETQHSVHPFPDLATELLNRSLLAALFPKRYPRARHRVWSGPTDVDAVLGAYLLVRREVLGDVGPLDDGYFFYLEETDWCFRMKTAGWRVVYNPDASAVHLGGATAARHPERGRVELFRSRYRYFRKFHHPLARLLLRSGLLVRLGILVPFWTLVSLLSLGAHRKARERARVYGHILAWHIAGCRAGWGLDGRE